MKPTYASGLRGWIVAVALFFFSAPALHSQSTQPADDFAHGLRLLGSVHDHVSSYDEPGFYWLCDYVRAQSGTTEFRSHWNNTPARWSELLAHPAEYRGRLVAIEGRVETCGRFEIRNRKTAALFSQCVLSDAAENCHCTIISPIGMLDVGVGTRARTIGYFLKIQRYETRSGELAEGPLLVVAEIGPKEWPDGSTWDATATRRVANWLLGATAFLAIIWLVMRRNLHRKSATALRFAQNKTGRASSGGDFEWLLKNETDQHDNPT